MENKTLESKMMEIDEHTLWCLSFYSEDGGRTYDKEYNEKLRLENLEKMKKLISSLKRKGFTEKEIYFSAAEGLSITGSNQKAKEFYKKAGLEDTDVFIRLGDMKLWKNQYFQAENLPVVPVEYNPKTSEFLYDTDKAPLPFNECKNYIDSENQKIKNEAIDFYIKGGFSLKEASKRGNVFKENIKKVCNEFPDIDEKGNYIGSVKRDLTKVNEIRKRI